MWSNFTNNLYNKFYGYVDIKCRVCKTKTKTKIEKRFENVKLYCSSKCYHNDPEKIKIIYYETVQ
jgi:hypothetical protein